MAEIDPKYYKRSAEQSSTSNYIQVNTTNPDGSEVTQSRLGETPDAKIITPQLKKDENIVKKLGGGGGGGLLDSLLASISKIAPKLSPSPVKQEVAEAKPTGEKAKYGSIQVKENKAGFVEIRDETPGNVRKIDLHPTGTYDSMLDNGDRIEKTTGKRVNIIDKNWEVVIFEDEVVVINRDSKIHIKQNKIETINGDRDVTVDKDSRELIQGNSTLNVTKDLSEKVSGNEKRHIVGNHSEQVDSNYEQKVSGKHNQTVGGNKNTVISGKCNINSGSTLTITSSSQIIISAPKVSIN